MGKKGKKAQAGKPKKLTPKEIGKRLDALVKKLEEELKGADLFAPLPPLEDCPICLVPIQRAGTGFVTTYTACCGKNICFGCFKTQEFIIEKQNKTAQAAQTCPFCRAPETSGEQYLLQLEDRTSKKDHTAFLIIGEAYLKGICVPKNELKALDYFIRSVELGSDAACVHISRCYESGTLLPVDAERCALFDTVGALRGDVWARNSIGNHEYDSDNYEVGIRHWKIAAQAGFQESLDALKEIYNSNEKMAGKEFISEEEMNRIYRACHEAQEEVKSEEREKHAAHFDF